MKDKPSSWTNLKKFVGLLVIAASGRAVDTTPPPTPSPTYSTAVTQNSSVTTELDGADSPAPFEVVMARMANELQQNELRQMKRPIATFRAVSVEPSPITESPNPLVSTFSLTKSLSEKKITYANMHSRDYESLVERMWELYDIYFDSTEISERDFQSEREAFIRVMFGWVLEFTIMGIAAGVVGNLAYDKLKYRFERLHDASAENTKKYYKRLQKDLKALLTQLEQAELKHAPVHTNELASATGISKEVIRSWLKQFGYAHRSNCAWEPVKRVKV